MDRIEINPDQLLLPGFALCASPPALHFCGAGWLVLKMICRIIFIFSAELPDLM